jgi:hypothetical protein
LLKANDAGDCTAVVTYTAPVGTDNCTGATTTQTAGLASGAAFPLGVTTNTFVVTDGAGNTATCSFTVTITDTEDPAITCPANIVQANDAGDCTAVVTYTAPVGTDNCTGATTTQTAGLASGAAFPVGVTTNTFVVTDGAGNTATCSFTVTITDTEDPAITCPANIAQNNDAGDCTAVVTYTAPVGTDNCTGATTTQTAGLASGAAFPVGVTTNTFVVTDGAGNTATCSFTVTITDTEDPAITCPANIAQNNDAGDCTAVVTYTAPVGTDNCTGATTTQTAGLASGAAFPVGVTTNTFVVTDGAGNTATCSFTVTITDTEDPAITCPANIVQANDAGDCTAVVTYTAPVGTDNCTGATTTQTAGLASGATFPLGVTTNTFVVTDGAGNTATCSFTVTITDTEDPAITCPANIAQNNDAGDCTAVVTYTAPVGTDNCTGATTTQTAGLASGAAFPVGVTTNTFVVTDGAGNTATCSFTVTITDTEDPAITCPANIAQNTDAGNCTAVVTVVAPTTTDNCGVASVTNNFNGTSDASGTYPIGTTTVVWTVTDNSGNIDTCSMGITVTDNEAPNAVCQDITASVDASGNLTITGDDVDGGSTDNCTGMTLSVSPNTFDCSDTGTTVAVILTATDAAGLTDTCTANVTIIDQVAPTAVCQDITVQLDATGNVTITAADVDNGSSDGCGGAVTLALTPSSSFDCDDLGANTVNLFVTDASGNVSFCTATVTVEDSIAPTITCAADQTQNLDAGLCTAAVTVVGPTISDNCSVASITNDFNSTADASDDYPLGTTTVTWTLTDGSGNTATCTQDIVVTDNQAPVAVCQDITVQLDATGAVTINASDIDGGSTDCSSMTFAVTPSSTFDCDDLGPNTVTLFVTDANGLIGFCAAVVTVEDSIDPTIVSIPGDIAVNNDPGACGAVVSWTEPTTTDNCSSTISQTTGVANGSQFPVGATTVTYVATDNAGNTTQDTFTVTVTDVEAPTASCVASPLTVQLDASGVATITADDINDGSSDNCTAANALTLAIDKTSFDCDDIGSTTVTLTVTDEYSNSATCTTTVNVFDTVAPAITCPSNQTQSLGAGCVVALADYTSLATTSDNCAVSSVTQSPAAGTSILGETTTTVTLTVTDTNGNQNTCDFDVVTVDTTNPTISCAADQTQSNDTGSCDALVTVIAPTTSDFCGVASVTNDFNGTSDASGTYPVGTTTVVWTVTDDSGNTATCSMDITVTDDENPQITCPADISVPGTSGAGAVVTYTTPVGTDNCTGATTSQTAGLPSGSTFPLGTTTNTFEVEDASGNTTSCSFTVEVTGVPPSIVCPADIVVDNDSGNCDAIVTFAATETTGVPASVITYSQDPGTAFPVGVTTVTATATNAVGTDQCTFTITVNDTEAPAITCPAAITTNNDTGDCSAVVTYTTPVGTDNCTGATTTQTAGLASGSTFPAGTTTNTFVVTDAAGLTATCSFDVTVNDTENPAITCPADITTSNDTGDCSAVVTYTTPVGTDNCTGATTTQTAGLPSGSAFPVGVTTNTFEVTDAAGNTATCSFDVTVNDTEDPAITCPADITTSNDTGDCSAVVTYTTPVGTDNCTGATTTQTAGLPSGSTFPVGVTTNTFEVTDAAGNSTTCSFTVTVNDTEDPAITCPADITTSNDTGDCSAVVTYTTPVGTDNCTGATTTQTAGLPSGSTFPVGVTTNTFEVTDAAGNSTICSFTVTVNDTEDPAITCPADITTSNDTGDCSAVVTYTTPVGTDNCTGATTTQTAGLPSGSTFPVGTTTNTFEVTDAAGNSTTCSFTVTVNDTENPAITCPADIATSNDTGDCSAVVTYTTPVGTDNCTGATTTQMDGLPSGSAFPVGTTSNIFEVTDAAGNTAICAFEVTVIDTEAPAITCPAAITTSNDTGDCSAVVTYTTPVGTDNCTGATTTQTAGLPSGSTFPVGATTNTFEVTDAAGNSTTCSLSL